jgi:hypothetical protein
MWQLWSREAVAAKALAPPAPAHRAVTASVWAGHECSADGVLQMVVAKPIIGSR